MKRRYLAVTAALVLSALLLTACGTTVEDTGAGTSPTGSVMTAPPDDPEGVPSALNP